MHTRMMGEFPELYTKQGKVRKASPKKYKCGCGSTVVKIKTTDLGGIKFGCLYVSNVENVQKKQRATKYGPDW